MIMIATSISWENPRSTASGRNTASYPTSFRKLHAISGFGLANALPNFSAPPMAISQEESLFSEIIYGSIQNCWHWQMKQRPYHTCQDTKDNRVRGDSFQGSDKLCGIKFTAPGANSDSVITAITL